LRGPVKYIDQKTLSPPNKWIVTITGFGFGSTVDEFLTTSQGFNSYGNTAIISTRQPYIYIPGCKFMIP
jgi:hypothetical protein